MNTQTTMGIPQGRRPNPGIVKSRVGTDLLDIASQGAIPLPLIAHLASEHTAILEKWKRKFALDLSWHRAVTARQ